MYMYKCICVCLGAQCVLHGPIKLQPHNEEVIIIQDPDEHEICYVDARGFKTW